MKTARETVMAVKAFGLALVACALAAPAFAHQSFAMFDAEKAVTMTGVVKEFEWTNPHSGIRMMVEDLSETARQWALEMGSPGQNAQRGWKADTLKPGDKVTVTMHPLKDGSRGGQFMTAVLPNGQTLGNGGQRNNTLGNE
jgi:hypothetical protein